MQTFQTTPWIYSPTHGIYSKISRITNKRKKKPSRNCIYSARPNSLSTLAGWANRSRSRAAAVPRRRHCPDEIFTLDFLRPTHETLCSTYVRTHVYPYVLYHAGAWESGHALATKAAFSLTGTFMLCVYLSAPFLVVRLFFFSWVSSAASFRGKTSANGGGAGFFVVTCIAVLRLRWALKIAGVCWTLGARVVGDGVTNRAKSHRCGWRMWCMHFQWVIGAEECWEERGVCRDLWQDE